MVLFRPVSLAASMALGLLMVLDDGCQAQAFSQTTRRGRRLQDGRPDGGPPDGGPPDGGGGGGGDTSVGVVAVTTCDESTLVEGACSMEGTSNYVARALTYTDGKFSGTITTNQCAAKPTPATPGKNAPMPDCIEQTFPAVTSSPSGSPTLGRVAMTFFGENVYGPLDGGFQEGQVCTAGFCESGTDLTTCARQLNATCTGTFEGIGQNGALLGECGGHADPYHYHTDLVCHYDLEVSASHSPAVALANDGQVIYGRWEGEAAQPDLDICNGHTGPVPDDTDLGITAGTVYHYHTTMEPPYTLGCYGPVETVAECKALYTGDRGCGGVVSLDLADTFNENVYTADVDTWCTCYGEDDGIVTVTSTRETPAAVDVPADAAATIPSSSALLSPSLAAGLAAALLVVGLSWV